MSRLTKIINDPERDFEFTMRVLGRGDRYGRDWGLVHERDEPVVEFYDRRYHFEHDPTDGQLLGQFVSRYPLSSLAETRRNGLSAFEEGINLQGGVPDWQLSAVAMRECRRALEAVGFRCFDPSSADLELAILHRGQACDFILGRSAAALDADILAALEDMTGKMHARHASRDSILRQGAEAGILVETAPVTVHAARLHPITHALILDYEGVRAGFAATSANSLVQPVREFLTERGLEDPRDEHMCLLLLELRDTPGLRFSYAAPETQALETQAQLDTAPGM